MRKPAIALACLVLAFAGVMLYWLLSASPPDPETASRELPPLPAASHAIRREPTPPPDLKTAPFVEVKPTGVLARLVDDRSGASLLDGILYTHVAKARRITPEDITQRWVPDPQGVFRLATLEALASPELELTALARGYLARPIPVDDLAEGVVNVIPMSRGVGKRFRFLDAGHVGVADVRVQVSALSFAPQPLAIASGDPALPGGAPRAAIHEFWSDASGDLEISGLPRGSYFMRIDHAAYLPQSIPHAMDAVFPIDLPGPAEEILMLEVYGAVARVEPASITGSVHWTYQSNHPWAGRRIDAAWDRALRVFTERLKARFPDCCFARSFVPVCDPGGAVPHISVTMHVCGNAPVDVRVLAHPIDEIEEPQIIKFSDEDLSLRLTVNVFQPDETLVNGGPDLVNMEGTTAQGVRYGREFTSGVPLEVPPGRYRVGPFQSRTLRDVFPRAWVEVHNKDVAFDVQLKEFIHPCRWVFPNGFREPASRVKLSFRCEGKPEIVYNLYKSQFTSWFPASSSWSLTVQSPGCQDATIEFTIPDGPPTKELEWTIPLVPVDAVTTDRH